MKVTNLENRSTTTMMEPQPFDLGSTMIKSIIMLPMVVPLWVVKEIFTNLIFLFYNPFCAKNSHFTDFVHY